MALQYLDGVTIPYFVSLRSSGGTFQGSWSMVNTMRYQQGDIDSENVSSAILIGRNGAYMGLTINFDEIDWASCDPAPAAYGTDEEIMTYLNTLFTGQLGTLVPPVMIEPMIFLTEPIQEIDLAVDDGTYYIPLNGNYIDLTSNPYTIDQANMVMPVAGTFSLDCMKLSVTEYSASKGSQITLFVNGVSAGIALTINATGVLTSTGAVDVDVVAGDLVCLEMVVPPAGTDTFMASCISTLFTPA